MVFASFRRKDDLIEGITERLVCVEELLAHYLDYRPVDANTRSGVAKLAIVGTSRLRRMLQRSNYEPQHEQQMGIVVALVGRLVDIAANLPQFSSSVSDDDRKRIRIVVQSIGEIRAGITPATVPRLTESLGEGETPSDLPLLSEIEKTVALIPDVFTGA